MWVSLTQTTASKHHCKNVWICKLFWHWWVVKCSCFAVSPQIPTSVTLQWSFSICEVFRKSSIKLILQNMLNWKVEGNLPRLITASCWMTQSMCTEFWEISCLTASLSRPAQTLAVSWHSVQAVDLVPTYQNHSRYQTVKIWLQQNGYKMWNTFKIRYFIIWYQEIMAKWILKIWYETLLK